MNVLFSRVCRGILGVFAIASITVAQIPTAHAGGPSITATWSGSTAHVSGSQFTPGGKVDIFVAIDGSPRVYDGTAPASASWTDPVCLGGPSSCISTPTNGGNFTYKTQAYCAFSSVDVSAYDQESGLWTSAQRLRSVC